MLEHGIEFDHNRQRFVVAYRGRWLGAFRTGGEAQATYDEAAEVKAARKKIKHAGVGRSSKYVGVSWKTEYERWVATIMVRRSAHHLGYFDDEEAAARAYDEAAVTWRGPDAAVNFPQDRRD